jgi:hypothetical protein
MQRRRPPIAAVAKLLVGKTPVIIDDGLAVRVQSPRPPHELERR